MPLTMLFLDGVGIGTRRANPFVAAKLPNLSSMLGGRLPFRREARCAGPSAIAVPINATLGVPGFPQSGTGQTALFTGVNAPRLLGRHFGPYPYSTHRPIIREKSVFARLQRLGLRPCFANAYPRQFFHYIESGKTRLTVTTIASQMAGMPLRSADELVRNEGVSADITRERWKDLGYPAMPVITPREAGAHLGTLAQKYDFTLFEYFLTDHAGHKQSMEQAVDALERFDGLLGGILETFDDETSTILITSDHGNIESLDVRTHTRNPVPLIVAGRQREFLAGRITNLTHVTPAILELFEQQTAR